MRAAVPVGCWMRTFCPTFNAAKVAGVIFGKGVSDELAKAIYATSKKLGVSLQAASLLNIGQAITESGQGAATFLPQILQLVTGIARVPPLGAESPGDGRTQPQQRAQQGQQRARRKGFLFRHVRGVEHFHAGNFLGFLDLGQFVFAGQRFENRFLDLGAAQQVGGFLTGLEGDAEFALDAAEGDDGEEMMA